MASEVSVCNLALSHLGDEATVTAIDPPEGSEQAERCATFYPIARNTVLESHAWGCATTRESLVVLADVDPPDSWAYAYAYPNGCLRPLVVLMPGATDDDDGKEFVVEETSDGTRVIYTNVEDAELRYIFLQDDTTRYSMFMVNAIARLLASYLAGPIIKGSEGMKIAQGQLEMYEKVDLPRAKAVDGNGRRKDQYSKFTASSIAARA
jgi:hypothetical protein